MDSRVPLRPDYAMPFAAYLDGGEHLLWHAQPRQGIYLRGSDAIAIPFSLMWGGFAVVWESVSLRGYFHSHGTMPILFPLWGIPFVLIGIYITVGRFFYDSRRRRRTWYGLSSRRALILSGGRSQKLTSFDLGALDQIEMQTGSSGQGTITFGSAAAQFPRQAQMRVLTGQSQSAFEGIADVASVYQLIRKVQNESNVSNAQ